MKKNTLVSVALVGLLALGAAVPAFGMGSAQGAGFSPGASSSSGRMSSVTQGTPSNGGQQTSVTSDLSYSGQLSQMMQAIQADPGAISNYATAGQLMDQLGQTGMKVFANGQQVDFATYGVQPVIKDGRTMLPVRAIMSALDATVSWDPATQTVTVTTANGTTIQMTIGSNQMIVNGQTVTTDVAPYIDNGRMMLPLRAMAEATGLNVDWLAQSDMVVMTSGESTTSVDDSVYQGVYMNVYGE